MVESTPVESVTQRFGPDRLPLWQLGVAIFAIAVASLDLWSPAGSHPQCRQGRRDGARKLNRKPNSCQWNTPMEDRWVARIGGRTLRREHYPHRTGTNYAYFEKRTSGNANACSNSASADSVRMRS